MVAIEKELPKLSGARIISLAKDSQKSAEIVDLVFVSDAAPGIERLKKGRNFVYTQNSKRVKDPAVLARISKLVIPPAWTQVWICPKANGHLQATGFDLLHRKQYRYHPLWNSMRNQTKFYRMLEFGKALPRIRRQVKKDLSVPGLHQQKVLAAVVGLMELTHIRVGNNAYEKLYGSFGITTLKDKHATVKKEQIQFFFKGKKGVMQCISIRSKKLAKITRQCKDIPGRELFQYYDENGEHKSVDSGMVNQYIKEISGTDFSAKDFRTWAGSLHALMAFKEFGCSKTKKQAQQKIVEALDEVARHLGNTRAVCKKYYVHPRLLTLYEDNKLDPYLAVSDTKKRAGNAGLTMDEKALMKILKAKL